jgi:hypothetical protein
MKYIIEIIKDGKVVQVIDNTNIEAQKISENYNYVKKVI